MSSDKMGTSTTNSDAQSDKQVKLAKLQARKKELELLLATKNEELYKLCVQEVHLTGIVPPEAPLSPEPIVQIRPDTKTVVKKLPSDKKVYYNDDDILSKVEVQSVRNLRLPQRSLIDAETNRKHMSHRLSTPSESGMSTRSSSKQQVRRDDPLSHNYNHSSPIERPPETFFMPSSKTCPSLQFKASPNADSSKYSVASDAENVPAYRQHTVHTEQISKMYYNGGQQDPQNFSRVKETHFSSSHPDITTHYTHTSMTTQQMPQSNTNTMPLLYQYASHLKAQSQHLSGLSQGHSRRKELTRRNTLQRTQTYHLTSHSDYNSHLDNMNCNTVQTLSTNDTKQDMKPYMAPNMYHLHARSDRIAQPQHAVVKRKPSVGSYHQTSPVGKSSVDYNNPYSHQYNPPNNLPNSQSYGNLDNISLGGHSQHSYSEGKIKEKQWYETSLDSPTDSVISHSVSRESFCSLPKNVGLQRTPSMSQSHTASEGLPLSPSQQSNISNWSGGSAGPQSPLYRSDVPLESPKNCTVIEQGKWIPYREVSKPFEMSDFYKYSTKFRQANQKPPVPNMPISPQGSYQNKPKIIQEQWLNHNHL